MLLELIVSRSDREIDLLLNLDLARSIYPDCVQIEWLNRLQVARLDLAEAIHPDRLDLA